MKKVVITGASRGIGKAVAERFLADGWEVVGTSTSGKGWEHSHLTWVSLDLSKPESIERAEKEIAAKGPIDVLLNNSGINAEEEDTEDSPVIISALRKTLEVNLIGTIDLCERLLPQIAVDGHILFMGSGWGSLTRSDDSDAPSYSMSKVALSMYTRKLAVRLGKQGTTVSIVDPGWVQTDMGGKGAPRPVQTPAEEIFSLATSQVPSGLFWKEGKERPW